MGLSLAREHRCKYIETSAKTGSNIVEAFRLLVRAAIDPRNRLQLPILHKLPDDIIQEGTVYIKKLTLFSL